MTLPSDGFGIIAYLALIVPGVIFILVRSQLRGFRDVDRTVGRRLLLAFVVSAMFDAVYGAILGPHLLRRLRSGEEITPTEVAGAALLFLVAAIVVPAIVSWIVYGDSKLLRRVHGVIDRLRRKLTDSRYESTPTAWDLAATTTNATWVRIRMKEDVWVGGRFGDNSYFSTYPEPRDIFIEEQYLMTPEGAFTKPVAGTAGVWVAVTEECIVEWLYDDDDDE